MLAAILTCGLVLTTSCRKEVVPEKLEGLWYNQIVSTIYPGEYKDIIHTVLEFREDGVLIERSYHSYVDSRGDHLDRDRRHDLYTVNDEQLIELTEVGDPTNVSTYWWTVENNVLTLGHTKYESMESDFHPLTQEDLELMADLDKLCK